MFGNSELIQQLESSSSINVRSVVLAEWNMNDFSNIKTIGNYRYRKTNDSSPYQTLINSFDPNDEGLFYTDATYADVVIDGGYDNDGVPAIFRSYKDKEKMLFSLEDCFARFRPRSGINKARYFTPGYFHHTNTEQANRPRYYISSKDDAFKYWSSYRTENGSEFGISSTRTPSGEYLIEDTAPFVVYENDVPTNRIVVKMQTHVGSVDLGPYSGPSGTFDDPFYGDANSRVPSRWKIQYLQNNAWIDAISFNKSSLRDDGSPIIGSDGYVEIGYGLIVPSKYRANFVHISELISAEMLPVNPETGSSYLVKATGTELGTYYYYNGTAYESFVPKYGWSLTPNEVYLDGVSYLTEPVNIKQYNSSITGKLENREFIYIGGLRIVVESMNVPESSFDLIELSPRLVYDLTDRVEGLSINKTAADLGTSGIPVGQLNASTGAISIFDFDNSLSSSNTSSIISPYSNQFIQLKVYDFYLNLGGNNYVFPVKTLYSDGFPKYDFDGRSVSLDIRDLFFRLESMRAPEVFIQNASLSYAVSLLLDSIGFSNYIFKRIGTEEPEIPYFYINPDMSVAQVLEAIAVSTQSTMFFDEENNFVVMTKEYLLPEIGDRSASFEFVGENADGKQPNIASVSSQDSSIYNDGRINYSVKYIQKTYGSIAEAALLDRDKTWIYKPALLWESSGSTVTKAVNGETGSQSEYTLSAMPLNFDLSESVPTVVNGAIINNTINFGESVYWISRYNGYFYANGEIIRYDAVEYSVSGIGDVWITSLKSYQEYFAQVPFGGKIYPTGRVRIYTEPYYDEINGTTVLRNGAVARHGRGQFGTSIVHHSAGLGEYWYDGLNSHTSGAHIPIADILSEVGYQSDDTTEYQYTNSPGVLSKKSTRNSIIKNFISRSDGQEDEIKKLYATNTGTVQASALVFNGPSFSVDDVPPADLVSYTYKQLDSKFRHFGTRMRIIGRIENSSIRSQTPAGVSEIASINANSSDQSVTIGGAGGGIAVMLNPLTNEGYYLELTALTVDNIADYDEAENIHNAVFYKMSSNGSKIVPTKLWGAQARILVDSGQFIGQSRYVAQENPTVYDVAIEYEDTDVSRTFYIYINNKIVAIVEDDDPLSIYNNIALFVRGTSKCMFENVFAIDANYAKDNSQKLLAPVSSVFSSDRIAANESFRKYSMSGAVQSTYLSGLSPIDAPGYNMYFEEFGTIMREAAYFDIKYDKAYPALYAKISPTFNDIKGYTVSGFTASAYGAQFLVFNATDTVLSLDTQTGNYLRIQGVTFTQDSDNVMSVDDYFNIRSDFSNPEINSGVVVNSPTRSKKQYFDIKHSRSKYGKKEFSIDARYIQSEDSARELMGWMVNKTMRPRKSVGLDVFAASHIQLGDLVTINALDDSDQQLISTNNFVVYSIDYSNSGSGPETTIYLSEVI